MAQSVPYGDAYILQTPKTDRNIALLYNEQKQRQSQLEQQNKALDDVMSKEFANVRSADMNDVAQKWDQYKQLRKNVLFNKDLQRDANAYNQANRAAQIALSDVYGTINKSKEYKTAGEDERKSWLTKPDLYNDDFDVNYSQYINTPLSATHKSGIAQLDAIRDKFRYQGANYNPIKDLTAARGGNQVPLEVDAGVAPNDKLKNRVEVYNMHPATADQYKTNIIASMGKRDAQKYWYNQLDQTNPEEIQKVNDAFSQFDESTLKKFGIKKPDLQYHNDDSKAEAVATYLAQKYFLENQPRLLKTEDRVNEAGKLADQQRFAEEQQKLREKGADRRATIRAQFTDNNQYSPQAHVAAIIKNGTDTPTTYKVGEKWVGGKEIALPDEVEDKFYDKSNGKLVRPDKVLLDKDGKNVHLLYFTGQKSPTGSPLVNERKSRDIPIGTTLIPTLEKTFGNPKKNLYTNGSAAPAPQPSGYSQITETNKGQIGVKNGKWHYIKTGKPVE